MKHDWLNEPQAQEEMVAGFGDALTIKHLTDKPQIRGGLSLEKPRFSLDEATPGLFDLQDETGGSNGAVCATNSSMTTRLAPGIFS